jgi:hypothetical protein
MRIDAICGADNICGSEMVEDDSSCTSDQVARRCPETEDVMCTGDAEQPSPPECPEPEPMSSGDASTPQPTPSPQPTPMRPMWPAPNPTPRPEPTPSTPAAPSCAPPLCCTTNSDCREAQERTMVDGASGKCVERGAGERQCSGPGADCFCLVAYAPAPTRTTTDFCEPPSCCYQSRDCTSAAVATGVQGSVGQCVARPWSGERVQCSGDSDSDCLCVVVYPAGRQ